MEHIEERVEIVCGLIDMHDEDRSIGAKPFAQGFDGRAHGRQGIFALRASVVSNDDRLPPTVERDISDRLFEEWQCQDATARRNPGMPIIRTATFHDAMNGRRLIRHFFLPSPSAAANSVFRKRATATRICRSGE